MVSEVGNGVVLLGEAAQNYVKFKYFETIFSSVSILGGFLLIGWLLWRLIKKYGYDKEKKQWRN
jgi:hypothetical protein